MAAPEDKEPLRESLSGILFGMVGILLSLGPFLFAMGGMGEFVRAAGLSGTPGVFLVDRCYSEQGRRGAHCMGRFIAYEGTRSPVRTSIEGGPHPRGKRIDARYDNSVTAVGPGTAAAGFAIMSISSAFGLLMATGGLRFIIDRDAIYLPIARPLLFFTAVLGSSGIIAALIAIIIP